MKTSITQLAFVLLAFVISGCQRIPQARVMRVGLQGESGHLQVSVNGHVPRNMDSSRDFYKYLSELELHHGDLVVFAGRPSSVADQMRDFPGGLAGYCASHRVAIYLYWRESVPTDLFAVPIYNWTAPFNDPRDLSAATFFDEGRFLGTGKDGFDKMVDSIAKRKLSKVLVLGSLYNLNTQFGPFESPYEDQQAMLDRVIKENNTELVLLDPL